MNWITDGKPDTGRQVLIAYKCYDEREIHYTVGYYDQDYIKEEKVWNIPDSWKIVAWADFRRAPGKHSNITIEGLPPYQKDLTMTSYSAYEVAADRDEAAKKYQEDLVELHRLDGMIVAYEVAADREDVGEDFKRWCNRQVDLLREQYREIAESW